jgi:hypothetical protein
MAPPIRTSTCRNGLLPLSAFAALLAPAMALAMAIAMAPCARTNPFPSPIISNTCINSINSSSSNNNNNLFDLLLLPRSRLPSPLLENLAFCARPPYPSPPMLPPIPRKASFQVSSSSR